MKRCLVLVSMLLLAVPAAARPTHPARHARGMAAPTRPAPVQSPGLLEAEFHNTATPGDDADRTLARALDQILGSVWLKSAVNGVYVVDAVSGHELYAYGADRQLNPASNTKLVSTATALDLLGPDYAYPTRLMGPAADEDGVVHGDVRIVGSADPTLGPDDLRDLARHLAQTGIKKIAGDVLVGGDERDLLAHAWIEVTVIGGEREGEHAHVRVTPDSDFYVVDNVAQTAAGKKGRRPRLGVDVREAGARMRIEVSGRVRAGQEVEVTRAVPRPALFAAHTLRAAILNAGIPITGGVRLASGATPEGIVELARHESVPLRTLAAWINKPSNNFLADRLIVTAAAETRGTRTMAAGVGLMGEWLERVGIAPGSYRFENGSGLSHTIHISARQIAQVLLAGTRASFGPDWLASFAVGGKDGTLRSRFAGHPVAGYVRGKTGTLNGVAALSGFVTVDGAHSVCFSVLTNGFRDRRKPQVREEQAAIVDAIFGYLKAKAGVEPPPQVVPAAADGDVDSEDVAAPDDRPTPGVEL
jgi:D-alanyl-D-alanine carboxypeptidase/D-alanyl-D-alanine-endopeptidase (penicillin-binding protein 4)